MSLAVLPTGNGESVVAGVCVEQDGTLLAITPAASKAFKTQAGAALWLARRGYNVDGTRRSIPEAERVYPVRVARTEGPGLAKCVRAEVAA